MLSIVLKRCSLNRVDNESAVESALFLKPGVAVVPVVPCLAYVETIHIAPAWRNAVKAEARHTIHICGQQDAVPVYRRFFRRCHVRHPQCQRISLTDPT